MSGSRTAIRILLLVALLLPAQRAAAAPPPAQRLTSIGEQSGTLRTDGAFVVWAELDAASQTQSIYGLPVGGGERLVIATDLPAVPPYYRVTVDLAIDSGIVVWTAESNGTRTIRAQNLFNRQLATVATGDVSLPGISNNTITWWEDVDPSRGQRDDPLPATLKARDVAPDLSALGAERVVTRTPNAPFAFGPSLTSNSWVVWSQMPGYGYTGRFNEIYAVPLSGGAPRLIADTWSSEEPIFALFGDRVVMNVIHSSGRPEHKGMGSIIEIDLSSGEQVDLGEQGRIAGLAIGDRYVFWASSDTSSGQELFNLWGYDPLSNSAFIIAGGDGGSSQRRPMLYVSGSTLSWSWHDGASSALYAAPIDALLPTAPRPAPAQSQPDQVYFTETGHTLAAGFKNFWQRSGGLAVFGYPLTDEFLERGADSDRGRTTQYLERQRFELHPEHAGTPYEVLLGRLGVDMLQAQGRDWTQFPKARPSQPHYFAETGQAIAPEFYGYWASHGLEFSDPGVSFREALALFGYPISPPQMETNPDGDRVLTQWFERARFEYHPNNPVPHRVLLGRLGSEVLGQRDW